ncbi:hypothetical protein ONS96_003540 [Cadophora gregata f. sp. sojae]|nr:hypothetical protein ONS96_003540 [Cadophora gregata f. sp. sojae]
MLRPHEVCAASRRSCVALRLELLTGNPGQLDEGKTPLCSYSQQQRRREYQASSSALLCSALPMYIIWPVCTDCIGSQATRMHGKEHISALKWKREASDIDRSIETADQKDLCDTGQFQRPG